MCQERSLMAPRAGLQFPPLENLQCSNTFQQEIVFLAFDIIFIYIECCQRIVTKNIFKIQQKFIIVSREFFNCFCF